MTFLRMQNFGAGVLVIVIALGVYLFTLAPTVSFIDSGELAAVACRMGVAHPTGYPLFTLLGAIFSRLPVAREEIVRLNLMAALLSAAGVGMFFALVLRLLALVAPQFLKTSERGSPAAGILATGAAVGSALLLAFSGTVWAQAVAVEVYPLHFFFLPALLLTFLKATYRAAPERRSGRWWLLFAFMLGLSFGNHMTTVLLAPGLLALYFAREGVRLPAWKGIARMTPMFLGGLSIYAVLPTRAAQSPVPNWGNPVTLERLLWHIGGKQYRVWISLFTETAGRQLRYFLSTLPAEMAYVGLPLALIGLVVLWKSDKKLCIATILLFLGCVFYSINYDIHDIDSYFLLAYVCLALWGGCGLYAAGWWILRAWPGRTVLVAGAMIACGVPGLALHYREVDQSGNFLVEDYTMNMFASVEPRAVILSYQWDFWVSASYYYQLVRGHRPDVVVIDKELLRRSWYLKELEGRHPWLVSRSRGEVEAFKVELNKFEHELPYNPAIIQGRFEGMIRSFVSRSLLDRPVYVTGEIEPEFTAGLQRVPEGLAYRLYADTLFHPTPEPNFSYREWRGGGKLEELTKKFYADAYYARSLYYRAGGEGAAARKAAESALRYYPAHPGARALVNSFPR